MRTVPILRHAAAALSRTGVTTLLIGIAILAGALASQWPIYGMAAAVLAATLLVLVPRTVPPDAVPRAQSSSPHMRVALWSVRILPLVFCLNVYSPRLGFVVAMTGGCVGLGLTYARRAWSRVVTADVFALLATAAMAWTIQPSTRWELAFLFYFLCTALMLSKLEPWTTGRAFDALLDALAIYCIVSVGLYYGVGLRSPVDAGRHFQSMSAVGAFGARATFPLATAITTPPALAAAYLAAFAARRRLRPGRAATFDLAACGSAALIILASNGRAALGVGMAVAALVLGAPKLLRTLAPITVVAAMCIPLLSPTISPALSSRASRLIPFSDRGSASDLATFGNRSHIWRAVMDGYFDAPLVRQLVGYGATGQLTSGISYRYSPYLRGFLRNPEYAPAHSSLLQLLLDSGAIGAISLLTAIVLAHVRLRRTHRVVTPALGRQVMSAFAILTVLGWASATDALLAPGQNQETYWIATAVCVLAAIARAAPVIDSSKPARSVAWKQRGRRT